MFQERRGIKGFVFQTGNGTPYSPDNVRREFKRALAVAGLPKTIRVHDLRHTAITDFGRDGVSAVDAMKVAGHSDIQATLGVYSHGTTTGQRRAVEMQSKRVFAR